MAFEAGAITGRIDLNTTSFHNGMNEIHTHAESAGGEIRETFEAIAESLTEALGPALGQIDNQLQSVFAGFSEGPILGSINAIGVGVGMLREDVMSVGGEFASLHQQAEKLGVSVEFLSKLGAAARTVGVDTQTLSNGLFMLNREVDDAVENGGEAANNFARLGFSTAELNQHMGDTQWIVEAVLDRLDKLPDAQTRARVAMGLLGRGTRELAPLLRLSTDEIRNLGNSAEAMGGTMTEADDKVGAAFSRLNADLHFVQFGIEKAFAKQILTDFAGGLDGIESDLKKIGDYVGGTLLPEFSKLVDYSVKVVIPDAKFLYDLAKQEVQGKGGVVDTGKGWLADIASFNKFVDGMSPMLAWMDRGVSYGGDALKDFNRLGLGVNQRLDDAIGTREAVGELGYNPLKPWTGAPSNPFTYTGKLMGNESLDPIKQSLDQLVMTIQDTIRGARQVITPDNAAATSTPPGSATSHSGPTTQPITVNVQTQFDPHEAATQLAHKTHPVMKKVHRQIKEKMESDYQKHMTEQSLTNWGMD